MIIETIKRGCCFVQGWEQAQAAMPNHLGRVRLPLAYLCARSNPPPPPPQLSLMGCEWICQEILPSLNSWIPNRGRYGKGAQKERRPCMYPTGWETPLGKQVRFQLGSCQEG